VREDGVNAWHALGLDGADALDLSGGVRTAEGVSEEHPGGEEVARVGELAGDLRDGVDPTDGFSDAAELEPT
jgi:hypothetical protein